MVNAARSTVERRQADRPRSYARHSGYPGGFRPETLGDLLARRPEEVIRRAVKGMLPRNKLGVQQLRKLKVYAAPSIRTRRSSPQRCPRAGVPSGMTTTPAFFQGTGRRKTSVARVRLIAGEGEVVVNGRTLEEHFGNAVNLSEILMPFRVTGTEGRYNAMVKVEGGGYQGQAGAIRHGIARALLSSPIPRRLAAAAAPGRLPDPRPAHEGTQEVRSEARPQGAAVHQALDRCCGTARADGPAALRGRSAWDRHRSKPIAARRPRFAPGRAATHAPCSLGLTSPVRHRRRARARVGQMADPVFERYKEALKQGHVAVVQGPATRRRWRTTRRRPRWPTTGRCRS